MVIFITEIVIFLKTSKQNEVQENGFRMEEFQKYFFLLYVLDLIDLLEQKFCPDSMYELVKYEVLSVRYDSQIGST